MLPRKSVRVDHISFHVMWGASLPRQGSFFTKNSSKAIHPPPTRTITVLRRIRTSRNCWESPNWNQGEIQLTGAPQCRFISPHTPKADCIQIGMMWQSGKNLELNFAFLHCQKKVSEQKTRKTTYEPLSWYPSTGIKLAPDGYILAPVPQVKEARRTSICSLGFFWRFCRREHLMFISLKNGDQLLNTVCWKVKWMAVNTKSSIKKTLAKHPHYKPRKKFGFCSSGSQK